jgi:hypothetical protein
MLSKRLQKLFFVMPLLMAFPSYANDTLAVNCPRKIDTIEKVSKAYRGWRVYEFKSPHYLERISLYSGKPEDMASLKPDSINRARAIWHLSSNETTYVVCEYNETNFRLTQPLPLHTSQCTLHYDAEYPNYTPASLICRMKATS